MYHATANNSSGPKVELAECIVRDCGDPVFCREFCKRHYMQMWRLGYIINDKAAAAAKDNSSGKLHSKRKIESVERKLKEANKTYANAGTVASRMEWRKVIRELESELEMLKGVNDEQEN